MLENTTIILNTFESFLNWWS